VAGDAAGHTAAAGEADRDMDLGEEGPDSTRWAQGDGRAAGTADVGGQPCRGAALAVVEVGGRIPYVQAADMSRWRAAVRWVVANG
jgi:hypothetical protein